MNVSLQYSIKYFKNDNKLFPKYFESFFQLMPLFRKDFQRNVQHSMPILDTTKRNLNVHFSEILVTHDVD